MATSMFSNLTSVDRRKKVMTYGKSSRLSTIPTPAPALHEDAPPPKQPRKQTAASNGSLQRLGKTLKAGGSVGGARARTGSPDVFDVPSEDEFVSRPTKPAKKLPAKHRTPEEVFDVPLSEDEPPAPSRKPVKAIPASRKPEPAKTAALAAKRLQKPNQLPKPVSVPPPSSNHAVAPRIHREKIPQPPQKTKQNTKNGELVQQPKTMAKSLSRAKTPTLSALKPPKNAKPVSILPSRRAFSKCSVKAPEDLDVFDVPSSDEEETPLPISKPIRQVPAGTTKKLAENTGPAPGFSHKELVESDDSNASKKRKRRCSASSVPTVEPTKEREREPSLPQRSRKYQKKEHSMSPGYESLDQPAIAPTLGTQPAVPAINKPRRTRIRTVPVLAKPTIAKGQSSPATLNGMLPARQLSKPSPVEEVPEATALEDETMYEVTDSLATPVRAPKVALSGSVTPRQKALFNSLLGESSSSTTLMPRISALQLTDQKPRSPLGALLRSKSDLTYNAQARKTRLIDTIKRAETSSEDEDEVEESTSESEEETDGHTTNGRVVGNPRETQDSADIPSNGMDVDVSVAVDSQVSQATSTFGNRARLTYAKSRSYLQEANPEDDLLISMDLDDDIRFDSQNQNSLPEDEEDPLSQVRARHELKRQGQQTTFEWETRMSIDDISSETSNAVRRSAMMELCTKMVDETFTSQLLDSSLAEQFFKNISSNGEIIFDFATAVAIVFILKTDSSYTILNQIHHKGIITTLVKLANNDVDLQRIAKDRKTNLSKIAQESVKAFRTLVQDSSIWTPGQPVKVSPQLLALKALESLIVGLRRGGSVASLVDQDEISKLVDIASNPSERLRTGKGSPQDALILDLNVSILEAISIAKQKQPTWPTQTLQLLADSLPVFFQPDTALSTMLAVKLCMNLTNNRPKACHPFSRQTFVQPLVSSIARKFGQLDAVLKQEQRVGVLESLILSLGAMINLAELSDRARLNVDDGEQMIDALVKIFLEGSERAAQADSMEESHSGVAIGYLTVLLGNLCLNASMRSKVRAQLPNQQLDTLIDKIKEFVRFHEHVDRKTNQFEGEEGQETWQNYTARLMLVVEKLEEAGA